MAPQARPRGSVTVLALDVAPQAIGGAVCSADVVIQDLLGILGCQVHFGRAATHHTEVWKQLEPKGCGIVSSLPTNALVAELTHLSSNFVDFC